MSVTPSYAIVRHFFIFFGLILILGVAVGLPVSAYAQATDQLADQSMDTHESDTGAVHVLVNVGPTFADQMAHVYVDFLAFLASLYLVLKLGGGKLRYPVLIIGLTSLLAVFISAFIGHQYMWIDGIIKSIGGIVALMWFLGILGLLGRSKTP